MDHGWVPTGTLASVWSGSVQVTCWIVLSFMHVPELESRLVGTGPAPYVKVPKVGVNAVEFEQQYRSQASVWLWWIYE